MRFFSTDNRLWQLIFLTTDIVLLGLLWIVLSLTIVGFGPASTALYYAIAKSIRRERGRPFREFFHALKQIWWKSMFAGLIIYILMIGICLITLPSDWSCIASLCILAFGTNRGNLKNHSKK